MTIRNAEDAARKTLENASTLKSKYTERILGRIEEACLNNKWNIEYIQNEMDGTTRDYLYNNGFRVVYHIKSEKYYITISWG